MRIFARFLAVFWICFPFVALAKPSKARSLRRVKISWKALQRGVSYGQVPLPSRSPHGDNTLHLVRIEPSKVKFRVLLGRRLGDRKRTARQWTAQHRLAVAVNLGMFQQDHRSHVGFLRVGKRIESKGWRRDYLSMLVIGPKRNKLSQARLLDLDKPRSKRLMKEYQIAIQNLRLIKQRGRSGRSVWKSKHRKWSEMLLAMDRKGRLYFVFCRTPFSMWHFTRLLLRLPLGIIRAMHLEGGPEASLSINTPTMSRHFSGSYETSFNENDSNQAQWPIPNVLGILREDDKPR